MPIMRKEENGDCNKWCLENSEKWFPANRQFYPLYCSGLAVIMSSSIVPELYQFVTVNTCRVGLWYLIKYMYIVNVWH